MTTSRKNTHIQGTGKFSYMSYITQQNRAITSLSNTHQQERYMALRHGRMLMHSQSKGKPMYHHSINFGGIKMLPMGLIQLRLEYIREQIYACEQHLQSVEPYDEKTFVALKGWIVAEHELAIILEDPDFHEHWLEQGWNEFIKKMNEGNLETDHEVIFKRYMNEFGMDNSWYAQHLCSLKHIGGNSITLVQPEHEELVFKAYDNLQKAIDRINKRNIGIYVCAGCHSEVNKHEVGYNKIGSQEFCDSCAKKVKKFPKITEHDCKKCLHPHYQNERTGEPTDCSYAGCDCKEFDNGE